MTIPRILLTGSSGLIGTSLVRNLEGQRISTVVLHRQSPGKDPGSSGTQALWDPYADGPAADPQALAGVTGAVHLSGVNVAGRRWSSAYKREILDSRVKPTRALAALLAGLDPKPEVLVCASAIGIYGGRGNEVLDESSAPGSGFLAEVCAAWEKATQPASDAGIRVVHLRFGVVLSPQGGALARMVPLFRTGLGGPLGNGRQWMSWVTLPDAVEAIEFVLATASPEGPELQRPMIRGPVNLVAPNPVTNLEFTRVLADVLNRPAVLPIPAFALRLALGEMAEASVLESARVVPARLQSAGFRFKHPELRIGLEAVLGAGLAKGAFGAG